MRLMINRESLPEKYISYHNTNYTVVSYSASESKKCKPKVIEKCRVCVKVHAEDAERTVRILRRTMHSMKGNMKSPIDRSK